MWMKGSILKSLCPASSTSTEVPGSADRRFASAHPAEPPPTITKSHTRSGMLPSVLSAVEPALGLRVDVVPDVLGLAILVETRAAELTADAGLLVAAPLGLGHVGVVVVDPDRPHPQPAGDALCLAGVLRPHRTGQAVEAVVGDPDRIVLVGEGLDGEHRSERLLLGYRHVAAHVVEDGGQVVVTVAELLGGRPLPAAAERRPLGDTSGDIGLHLAAVLRGDERTGLGVVVERAADANPSGAGDELVDELVVDGLLDDQPGPGRADLPGVQEHGRQSEVERRVAVGVGEHDVGVLATELERDLLHGGG